MRVMSLLGALKILSPLSKWILTGLCEFCGFAAIWLPVSCHDRVEFLGYRQGMMERLAKEVIDRSEADVF